MLFIVKILKKLILQALIDNQVFENRELEYNSIPHFS